MVLQSVKEDNGWLESVFALTYRVGWEAICNGMNTAYDSFDRTEILVDDKIVEISSKEDILKLEEAGNMTIRGISKLLKVPVLIRLFNQTNVATLVVGAMNDEFKDTNYEKFNKSVGQFMDSLELNMYR